MHSRNVVFASLALSVVCLMAGAGYLVASLPLPRDFREWGFPGFQGVAAIVFTIMGTLIVLRHPGNLIGWLLFGAGMLSALQFSGHYYAVHAIVNGACVDSLVATALWFEDWIWIPVIGAVGVFTMLLFPTGTLPSNRWRPLVWTALGSIIAGSIAFMAMPLTNGSASVPFTSPLVTGLASIAMTATSGCVAASVASLIGRYRQASGIERQQLKWLALAGAVLIVVWVVYFALFVVTGDEATFAAAPAVAVLMIPAAIGVAILRHRLLDIDLLINRTLVYTLVSVMLGAVYALGVLILQGLLGPMLAGGGTLAVAASTLAVSALFQPVRRRVQVTVDHRFYRSRYDVQRTLERFGARLRNEIDLDALSGELISAAHETMRPTSAGVWLRHRTRPA
ncbi:MAG: hypothetical protein ACR2GO_04245 [Candidatus Limnocylindria bacterium]